MLQDGSGHVTHLLGKEAGGDAVAAGIVRVEDPQLLGAELRRDQLPDHGQAQALLHGEDDEEIRDVLPEIALLHRLRHHLRAHVVVDGGRRDELLLLQLRGQIIQIFLQKVDELIHVEAEIRDILPLGQAEAVEVSLPPAKLAGHQFTAECHGIASSFCAVYHFRLFSARKSACLFARSVFFRSELERRIRCDPSAMSASRRAHAKNRFDSCCKSRGL